MEKFLILSLLALASFVEIKAEPLLSAVLAAHSVAVGDTAIANDDDGDGAHINNLAANTGNGTATSTQGNTTLTGSFGDNSVYECGPPKKNAIKTLLAVLDSNDPVVGLLKLIQGAANGDLGSLIMLHSVAIGKTAVANHQGGNGLHVTNMAVNSGNGTATAVQGSVTGNGKFGDNSVTADST